jgi:hypothetical protein
MYNPIQYREPESKEELSAIFELRHKVYSEDLLLSDMVSSNTKFDINLYDINAFHFAAFIKNTPIAYIRITSSTPNKLSTWTEQIILENGIELNHVQHEYPFEKYYPDNEWSVFYLNSLSGLKIGEVGKLVIHQDYRAGGLVLNELISLFHSFCFHKNNYDVGFGSCTLILERYYQKFGFERVENSTPFTFQNLPEAVIMQFKKEKN